MAMKRLLAELKKHEASWPFVQPVNTEEVTDYRDVVKYPMGTLSMLFLIRSSDNLSTTNLIVPPRLTIDLGTIETKLERDAYTDFESFVADARLIFSNCKLYNHEASQYAKLATRMEKFLDECLAKLPSYKQESGAM